MKRGGLLEATALVRRSAAAQLRCNGKLRTLPPVAHVDEVAGDRGRGGHRGRHQMGATLEALASLEVAVRGRGAALFRRQLVRVHREAHRAARLTPFEACLEEDLVETF